MIIRQLKPEKFKQLEQQLIKRAQQNPLEASYHVTLVVNQTEYQLKIQPDKNHKFVALKALQIEREECGFLHELITDNNILSALTELLIRQGVPR